MSDDWKRDFQRAKGELRWALLTDDGLVGADRHVGLIMIEWASGDHFRTGDEICSWQGVDEIGRLTGLSRRTIQQARAHLVARGAVAIVLPGGHGKEDRAVWSFDLSWARRVAAEVKMRPRRSLKCARAHSTAPNAQPGLDCPADALRAQSRAR
jgi:hypothetical protein